MRPAHSRLVLALLGWIASVALPSPLAAERMLIRTAEDWQTWTFSPGALHVEDGRLRPIFNRKNINAALGGFIRGVGTNPAAAAAVIDGDRQSGWAPDPADPVEDWWIEVDLGQVLPVQQIRFYFDAETEPFSFLKVSLSNGERFINNVGVRVEGTLLFNASKRFSFNEDHILSIPLEDEPVQVIRLEASRRVTHSVLTEVEVDAFGDNVAFDLIERGGSVEVEAAIVTLAGSPANMFDGDLASAWWVNPLAKGSTGGGETFGDYRIDLGASYWIDSIWIMGDPIGIPPGRRHIYANFLSYQILFSDGSLAPDGTLAWEELVSVPADTKNLFAIHNFQHHFAPVAARYLRLFYPTSQGGQILGGGLGEYGHWDGLGLVGEFQIFGVGHPPRVILRSPVIDLGADWNITSLEWRADTPPGTRLLFRSRSGNEVVEKTRYFDKKGKKVTQRRWEKLIKSFRGPVVTTPVAGADWSTWGKAYTLAGTDFRSPSPRRYFQLEAEFLSSDPLAAATLEELIVNYSRPLVRQVVGEIFPHQVEPGIKQDFSYFLRPEFIRDNLGFDQVALESSVPMDFAQVRVNDRVIEVSHQQTDAGFRLKFPALMDAAELLEIRFGATIFQNHTRFRAFLEKESGDGTLRQRVDPGDAVPDLEGASDVVTLPLNRALFAHLEITPEVFTPNGDGRNDVLRISFDVLKLLSARPVRAWIYELQGRKVRQLADEASLASHRELRWDGRDEHGELVPPGLYLFHLEISGDATTPPRTSSAP